MSIPVLNNLHLNLNQLLSAVVENLAADPGTVTEGRIFYHTVEKKLKVGRNAAWVSWYLDTTPLQSIAPPTGPVSANTQKITNLADGTAAGDAINKSQLDAVIAGLDFKASVRVATTAAGTLATNFKNGDTVDGIVLVTGDRILIKNQAAAADNGIYIVTAGAPTRATDFDAWLEIPGSIVAVEVGTANADTVWLATADQGGTLGTTAVTWSKIAPAAAGGTVNKFAADITGDAVATNFTVTHNLGTTDVAVEVWDVAADLAILVDKKRPTANTVRIDFAAPPANLKVYRVVVTG